MTKISRERDTRSFTGLGILVGFVGAPFKRLSSTGSEVREVETEAQAVLS